MTEHKHLDHSLQQRTLYLQILQTPISVLDFTSFFLKQSVLKETKKRVVGRQQIYSTFFFKFHLKRGEGKRGEV